MTSTSAPFGLKPMYHPSGTIRQKDGTIASGYATGIFKNSPVKVGTDGNIQAAAVGDRIVGAFVGCEYTSAGKRWISNQWPASTVSSDAVCYFTADPDIVYAIQASATVAQTAIGEHADFAVVTGSTSTGYSTATISATTSAVTTATLAIDGLLKQQDNAWGDTYPILLVRISEHQYTASPATF